MVHISIAQLFNVSLGSIEGTINFLGGILVFSMILAQLN